MRYYDTNIFQHAQNPAHSSHADCLRITDPEHVSWNIAVNMELIGAESTVREFVEQLLSVLVSTSPAGIAVSFIENQELRATIRSNRPIKKHLEQYLQPMDIKHAMSALAAKATVLVSNDSDFWDPVIKAGRTGNTVERILSQIGIRVCEPSRCL